MNEAAPIKLKSFEIVKQLFDIEGACEEMVTRKPRVSRNVLQAYHKDVMEIAKGYKQLFLDIVDKKQK